MIDLCVMDKWFQNMLDGKEIQLITMHHPDIAMGDRVRVTSIKGRTCELFVDRVTPPICKSQNWRRFYFSIVSKRTPDVPF